MMKKLNQLILKARVWSDTNGQDLIEYALMSGFVAVAAGAIMPGVSQSISRIFSSVVSSLKNSASQGS
jgi:pilus assembly protein Flp/PilA